MCDTMVALGNSTRDGSVLFAKNSDRQPNEPHILIHIPRREHGPGATVKCTYIEVEQSPETYEVFLLKPSWIWGCEMGGNEFGLNIGNEAVFTREKYEGTGLTGMDLIRLALERCRTSEEAMDLIIALLERYGQGGNCGYQKKFTYHNSFLIADKESAWVLETAGQYWAAERVKDVRSISNCLSIGTSFDRAHPRLIEHAVEKGWCQSERDFDFARCYSDPLFTYFSGARNRGSCSQSMLEQNKGKIDAALMKSILRWHQPAVEGKQFRSASLRSVCMHGGGLIGDHTTGSYIASLTGKRCTYWVTGASTSCLASFKPLWLLPGAAIPFPEEGYDAALNFWQRRELLHRLVLQNRIDLPAYLEQRDRMEEGWMNTVERTDLGPGNESEMAKIMATAWSQENELVERVIGESQNQSGRWAGNPYFRRYWRLQTGKLTAK
jgi:hypothetical protein